MELSSLPHSPTEDDGKTASSQAGAPSDDVKFFTPRNDCLSNVNTFDPAAMSLQGQSSRDNKRKAAQSIVEEIDLLLSSTTPSSLIPALASVFVTPELQAIPSSTLETNVGDNKLETTKLYSTSSITAAKEQLNVVQSLGTAAVEEWLKGLGAQGKEHRIDASRWEKWAAAGGLAQMCRSVQTMGNGSIDELAQDQDHEPRKSPQTSLEDRDSEGRSRSDKTHEEAAARKALRRAEIERRAMLLDPPLPPNVVVHMPSFQAAIQITAALDENAWNTLKPKLLSQRADAERNINRGLIESRSSSIETKVETTREVTDQDWDDIQGPVRARMSKYADEIIRGSWNKGRKVNKENSPRFAAGVLLSVRSRFYADVAKDAADAIAAGRQPVVDPQGGPFTQKLTLENMKWVFDMKIKQHTESYRKELFLCNVSATLLFTGEPNGQSSPSSNPTADRPKVLSKPQEREPPKVMRQQDPGHLKVMILLVGVAVSYLALYTVFLLTKFRPFPITHHKLPRTIRYQHTVRMPAYRVRPTYRRTLGRLEPPNFILWHLLALDPYSLAHKSNLRTC
ncbi:hypothetical protein CTAM01_04697 [Colletotrichum tamarilloi]|uniref:Uncharacterized protein n=1 Tax=Colletotrichum tamarilloi TaxID=1209934 RepID=A0ABQ9RGV0_9PEZI|nr:uncharacterized protein CTAM01_04697 [Colletotrichum tamarilloi]KAK1503385.1 hypothetical protein CTAM01_04697 [Colletotrichum tamarilloi]